MNILISCDDNYLMPQKVALHSFFESNPSSCPHVVYMLRSNLSEGAEGELRSLVESFGSRYVSVAVDPKTFEGAGTKSYISIETYYRLLAAYYLPPEVDRVLWLDSDILVRKSLDDLYGMDFEGNWAIACSYGPKMLPLIRKNAVAIALSDPDKYFNAGVMLYDLEACRGADLASIQAEYLSKDRKLMFPGQDLVNNVFDGHVKIVDYRHWNSMIHCVADKVDLEYSKANAAIVHFPGRAKPWEFSDIHFADEWMDAFRRCNGENAVLDRMSYFGLVSSFSGKASKDAPKSCDVSVIVPAYNSLATLPRCVDSILRQLDDSMELIVVDDGSTDNAFESLRDKYEADSRVRLIRYTQNRGPGYARNTGIRVARGKFVAFCDADDEWLPAKLTAQLACFEDNPELDFVFTYDENILDDDSPESERIFGMATSDKKYHFRTGLFRKDVFERIGLMDETLRRRQDVEWVVRAVSSSCRFKVVEEPYYVRHVNSGSLSATAPHDNGERGRRLMDAFLRGVRRKRFENSSDVELSVLIPCWNSAGYIKEALDSCVSGRSMEIIVVDDGSADESVREAIYVLEKSGIQGTVMARPHKGQAASRNDALALARGKWIIYLDADDRFMPGALEDVMSLADSVDPETYLLSFLCEDFISPELTKDQASRLIINPDPYRRMLAGCMLARKSLYDKIGGFDETLPSSETAQWVLKARDSGAGVFESDLVTLARRYHMNNFGRTDRTTQIRSYISIIRSRLKK